MSERFMRLRAAAPRAAIAALAAAVSYFIAHEVFGHSSPFFAPVSAVIVLGITIGAQLQRALQLALGVAVGILAADLLVALIGNGGETPIRVALSAAGFIATPKGLRLRA